MEAEYGLNAQQPQHVTFLSDSRFAPGHLLVCAGNPSIYGTDSTSRARERMRFRNEDEGQLSRWHGGSRKLEQWSKQRGPFLESTSRISSSLLVHGTRLPYTPHATAHELGKSGPPAGVEFDITQAAATGSGRGLALLFRKYTYVHSNRRYSECNFTTRSPLTGGLFAT